ncbi:hypothetical protein [Sporisorium scitamineum]|uniref:JmjC domain-containing protein n=1 Tax=Sporisorium scitamineum TaxID=49012 RepID=A0A0F7S0N0_9BASI|nr:hypothetical protein [Sporisorium scitamineum]
MSDPRAQPHSAVMANGTAHTHESANLPQQQARKPPQPTVDPRPRPPALQPRKSPKSATFSALAAAPTSMPSSSATTRESFPSSSFRSMSSASSSAYTSPSEAPQSQSQPPRPIPQVNSRSSGSGQPSALEAASRTPQQTPNAHNVPPMQSPHMTATRGSPPASQSRTQASAAPTIDPRLRPACLNGHQKLTPLPSELPTPSGNTTPSDLASTHIAAPPRSQHPGVIQAHRSANVSQVTAPTAQKEQPQPLAKEEPISRPIQTAKQVGPSTTSTPPSQAALQPANPLDGDSTLDVSKQVIPNQVSDNAAASSSPRNDLTETSSPVASSPNNAVDPETLLGLRGSFLTSSEPVDYESLVKDNDNFKPIEVVSCLECSKEELEDLIIALVEHEGVPLVISDLHKCPAWDSDLFSPQRYEFLQTSGEADGKPVFIRNLTDWTDQALTLHDFMARCDKQRSYPPEQSEKLYGKDLPCPPEWSQTLAKLVHPRLVYHGEQDASASLPPKARSETQMCYFGPGHTCTPLHRDLCSSLGQNLMVWSDPDATALWMITHPDDVDAVDRYITSKGGDPYSEGYAPHPNELRDAPFTISCWKQRVGDLVLIPPRASHMVINAGGRTLKAAWPRFTIDTLSSAMFNDLPLYQRVCRVESYSIRPVIEEHLIACTTRLEADHEMNREISTIAIRNLRNLLQLYDAILADIFVPEWRDIKVEGGDDSYVECDFCGADVLHGYFECPEGETLCPLCYCQGRLCSCPNALEALQPRQHWRSFAERLQFRNHAAQVLLSVEPSLALAIEERSDAADDDADQEPPLLPVAVLKEEDVGKQDWPLTFMAAVNLYKLRQATGWQANVAPCKICKAKVDLSQRYHCKPCNHPYCHGCLLHKLYIHPAHTLAQNEPKQFHAYHKKLSTLDYKEWKQEPFEFRDAARAHFALIEAARTKMKCGPINQSCRIGFLDVTDKYPHGLSGTLGVKQRAKSQVEKIKTPTAAASPSTPSTPGSRKRPTDPGELASAASPRSRSNKKAKLDAPPTNPEPMDQDEIVVQVPRIPEAIDVPAITAVPLHLSRTVVSDAPAVEASASSQTKQTNISTPTVANGIRKFVLREGKVHPVTPVVASQRTAPLPTASPALSPSTAPRAGPSQPTMVNSSSSVNPAAPSAVEATPTVLAGPASTLIATGPPTIYTVARPSTSIFSHVLPKTNGCPSPGSVSAPAAKSMSAPAAAVPAAVPAASPASSTSQFVSPPSAAAAQKGEQGTLSLATNVAADGISSSPIRPGAASSPSTAPTGLGALDSMTLRVITEILRIFSQSNHRMIDTQVGEITATLAKQEEERRHQAKKDDDLRRTVTKMEATLQSMVQHNARMISEGREREQKRQEEIKGLRQGMDEVIRQQNEIMRRQASSDEQVGKLNEKISGLLHDIDQQAQAQLQAELATRSSQPTGSGQAMSSSHFAPTSNTR